MLLIFASTFAIAGLPHHFERINHSDVHMQIGELFDRKFWEIIHYIKIWDLWRSDDDILVLTSPNSKIPKSQFQDTENPGTSGTVRKSSLKKYFAIMLDSSSKDESQETSESVSADALPIVQE